MGVITDRGMQAKPTATDQWLTQPFKRGAGVFLGRITPSGERLFYFRYTDSQGKRPFLPIGNYHPKGTGGLTLAQAHEKAQALSMQYQGGAKDLREHLEQLEVDARKDKEAAHQAKVERELSAALESVRKISLRTLFDRWRNVDLTPRIKADGRRAGRKDGGQYTFEQFERHVFPTLGNCPAMDVRKADLLTILDGLKSAGKLRTCNVLLADLKQMFAFALARDIVERSPLDTVTRRQAGGTDTLRERVLSIVEIVQLSQQVPHANLSRRTEAAIWILLATGARAGELMGTVWAERNVNLVDLAALPAAVEVKIGAVDLKAATWYLPTTKNEREHTIHLSAFAIAQFEKLAALKETDEEGNQVPWIFPSRDNKGPVCVKSFGKQLADRQRPPEKRMSGRSKHTSSLSLPGGKWTAHDLRRTAGTLMASIGISGDVIDECLNHVIESRVRRTYIRDRRPVEQLQAFNALGVKLQEIVDNRQTNSVMSPSPTVVIRPDSPA